MVIKCNGYKFMAHNLYSLQFMVCLNLADSAVWSEPDAHRVSTTFKRAKKCNEQSYGPKNVTNRVTGGVREHSNGCLSRFLHTNRVTGGVREVDVSELAESREHGVGVREIEGS